MKMHKERPRLDISRMTRTAVLIALLLPIGCGPADEAAPEAAAGAADTASAEIRMSTTVEKITIRRFSSPADFPLQFTTWVPTSLIAQQEPMENGEGAALSFSDEPASRSSIDEYMHIYVYPSGTIQHNAQAAARSFLISRGIPGGTMQEPPDGPAPLPRYPWALLQEDYEYSSPKGRSAGVLLLAQHGDRFFHVIVNHGAGSATSFLPRAQLVLERWRWEDGQLLSESRDGAAVR